MNHINMLMKIQAKTKYSVVFEAVDMPCPGPFYYSVDYI